MGKRKYTDEEIIKKYEEFGPVDFQNPDPYKNDWWKYEEAVEKAKLESEEERKMHEWLLSIYPTKLPFCITISERKRFKWLACYSLHGSQITIFRRAFLPLNDFNKKLWLETLLHEYAHLIARECSKWDNDTHGCVFCSTYCVLWNLAYKKGIFDTPYNHNYSDEDKIKSNPVFERVCKALNVSYEELSKPNLLKEEIDRKRCE
jgi:hypothetical protein